MLPFLAALVLAAAPFHGQAVNEDGRVKTRIDAKSAYDKINVSWFSRFQRILAYPPAGDRYVPTKVPVLAYHDAYTKWGTNGLNPTRRAEYVAWVKRDKAKGYAGQFMDDIEWQSGYHLAGSRAEVANLIVAVREALGPTGVLELNTQMSDLKNVMSDPNVSRALSVTNVVDKEFGLSGVKFPEYVSYVGKLHAKGIASDLRSSNPGDNYSLAAYLLLNEGSDYMGGNVMPSNWWSGYQTNLGAATSAPQHSGSLWTRTFSGGEVVVNEATHEGIVK